VSNEIQSHMIMASADFSRLQAFVENLKIKADAEGALFRYLDFKDWTYPISMTCSGGLFTEEFFKEYDGGWGLNDPHIRVGVNRKMPDKSVYICSDHYSDEDRKDDPYFSEFLPRHDIRWMAGYLAQVDNQYAAGFALVRRRGREPFGENIRALLQPLVHLLEDSVRLLLHGQRTKLVIKSLEYAVERGTDFGLCVDAQGRILWESATAAETLREMEPLKMADGWLVTRSKAGEAMLSEIKEMARTGRARQSRIAVVQTDGRSYPLACVPVRAEDGKLGDAALGACILLGKQEVVTGQRPVFPVGDIGQLTKTEMRITELAAQGHSAPKIAEKMGVAPSTVRTHLKHIHRKLGINSRSELVALFLGNSQHYTAN